MESRWNTMSSSLGRHVNKRLFFTLVGVSWLLTCCTILNTCSLSPRPRYLSPLALGLKAMRLPPLGEARRLYRMVRVLCWVLTKPANHEAKARHVKRTWGRRCNKLLFMSSLEDPALGSINLNVTEGRQYLWNKTYSAFRYIYEHHMNDADWFLKADDDTYVIVENLRAFLAEKNSSAPVFYGHFFDAQHASGGAGYVLSRRSVQLLVERGINNHSCPSSSQDEDVAVSACLRAVGVLPGDSKDSQGHNRFHPFSPPESLLESYEYEDAAAHPPQATERMLASVSAISFHYLPPAQMYALEYFIYHFRLQGEAYPEPKPVAYYID